MPLQATAFLLRLWNVGHSLEEVLPTLHPAATQGRLGICCKAEVGKRLTGRTYRLLRPVNGSVWIEGNTLMMSAKLNNITFGVMIDTGSSITYIHPNVAERIIRSDTPRIKESGKATMADGYSVRTGATYQIIVTVGLDSKPLNVTVFPNLAFDVLGGFDLIKRFGLLGNLDSLRSPRFSGPSVSLLQTAEERQRLEGWFTNLAHALQNSPGQTTFKTQSSDPRQ
jgi:Aspartyl protease